MSSFVSSLAVAGAVLIGPSNALAQERASIEGFGGLSLNGLQSQSESFSPSLGGTVTFSLVHAVQIVGEAGRIGNVLPALSSAAFSAVGARASAFYGEGGLRLVAAPGSAFSPYAEASVGIARLNVHSDRFGAVAEAATQIALELAGRNTPTVGAGGGILLRGGPILFDVGYRYKQLFADDVMRIALGFGQPLRTHQARIGIGVRF